MLIVPPDPLELIGMIGMIGMIAKVYQYIIPYYQYFKPI